MHAAMLIAGLLAAAPATVDEASPVITGAEFFIDDVRAPRPAPKPGRRVPNIPGASCYQWVLFVEPDARAVRVREVFKLPAPAERWGTDPVLPTKVIEDRSGAVTEFDDDLGDGILTHGWCVAEGDPSGEHQIRVYVGDRLLHIFDFTVEPELH